MTTVNDETHSDQNINKASSNNNSKYGNSYYSNQINSNTYQENQSKNNSFYGNKNFQQTANDSQEILAVATRKSKSKLHKTKPYDKAKQIDDLKNDPIPIRTAAMSHNSSLSNNYNMNNNTNMNNNNNNNNMNNTKMNNYNNVNNINNINKNNNNTINTDKENENASMIVEQEDESSINHKQSTALEKDNGEEQTNHNPVSSETERLTYLKPSFITGKNISTVKKKNNVERIQDIINNADELNTKNEKEDISNKPSGRHIKLMDAFDDYCIQDLIKEVASTDVITKLAHLLDLFPKFRTEFLKALRLTPKQTLTNVMTIISKHKIIKVCGKVENKDCEIFLDTCASVNVITRSALNKLKINKPSIGRISETIFQAYSNSFMDSDIYYLQISIGSRTFHEYFRVIEKDDIFDILIGVDSLKNNRFDINLVDDVLYYIDENNNYIKLSDLFYDISPTSTHQDSKPNEEHKFPKEESLLLTVTISKNQETNNNDENINFKENLINNIISSAPVKIKTEIKDLFHKYINVIAIKTDDLGKSKLFPHKIELIPGSSPIKLKSYRLSKSQTKALKSILINLIKNKLIIPSGSSWAFPVVLVPKKNGDWRMCVDFRALNNITIKDSYSLPLIDDILTFIGSNAKFLSTIDLFSGYHQVPMHPDDTDKTTFTTMFGNYKFCVMPFGLCNAPATFQREMNRIFFDLIGECLFVYIDDLIIFQLFREHILHLNKAFQILQNNGLKINIEKCEFFKEEVKLLGHILSTRGISPIPDKIKVILNWDTPKNTTQLKSFLGVVGYYRKFIFQFANIANPLYALLKKDVPFIWTNSCTEAFIELKRRLTISPILTPPDFTKAFIIRTDASKDGLGGVLLQLNDDSKEVPIYFESRTLSSSELNYSITDLEGKAVYHCVRKFKPYITGNSFITIVYTDHKPLVSIFANKEPMSSRHLKWITELSILKVKVLYQEGKKNVIADALSRMTTIEKNSTKAEDKEDKIKVEDISKKETIYLIQNNNLNVNIDDDNNINNFMERFINKKIILIDGIEYYKQGDHLRKIIKNKEEQIKLIGEAHYIGHEGTYKTYNRLKRDYYWKNMKRDVYLFVKCCHRCQLYRPQQLNQFTEDIATKPGYPFSRVGLDLIGPLPVTRNSNKFIIVLVDYLTKWVEAEALKSSESEEEIKFLKSVFARHGIPEILTTDNGPQFIADKTKAFLDLHDVYVHYISTYHPASNGEVENRNREISKYLRLLGETITDWDETLPSALWALRTCKNEVTKFSSFELLYGRRDLQPFELTINIEKKNPQETLEEYWLRKFITHDKWIKEAIKNIDTANKLWEDRRKQIKRMKSSYKPGDLVLVKVFNRRKLDPYFSGPLQIVKKELNTVTVRDPISGEIAERNIHVKNIVPYFTEINLNGDEDEK